MIITFRLIIMLWKAIGSEYNPKTKEPTSVFCKIETKKNLYLAFWTKFLSLSSSKASLSNC
jgi:hypothetical protein